MILVYRGSDIKVLSTVPVALLTSHHFLGSTLTPSSLWRRSKQQYQFMSPLISHPSKSNYYSSSTNFLFVFQSSFYSILCIKTIYLKFVSSFFRWIESSIFLIKYLKIKNFHPPFDLYLLFSLLDFNLNLLWKWDSHNNL